MNILYISQYFPPEMGAPAARVSELVRHWVRQGHEVTVLTGFPNHPTGELWPEYRKKFRRGFCREEFEGAQVVRSWLLPYPNRKAYERVLNYSSFALSASLTGSFLKRPDVVIASSPQLFVGLTGWWVSRIKRVPFVFEVRDLWPESITASGMGREDSIPIRGLAKTSSFLYRHSDHIAVVTPAFCADLIENWEVSPEKISVVENGVETALFSSDGKRSLARDELNLNGRFVVSYIGTLGLAQGLTTLLEAAESLQRKSDRKIDFLLVGEGADRERLSSLIVEKGLRNVHLVGQQPREKIPGVIAASDVCLVLLRKAPVFETVIPTKMLEFMSCSCPVILGIDGQARQILEEAGAGLCVEPENSWQLTAAIERLYQAPSLCRRLGENGRRYVVQNLSREETARKYIGVLERVVNGD